MKGCYQKRAMFYEYHLPKILPVPIAVLQAGAKSPETEYLSIGPGQKACCNCFIILFYCGHNTSKEKHLELS